jgi:hypothetical protein
MFNIKSNVCLAIAADWEGDRDFVRLLEQCAHEHGLATYVVKPLNLAKTIDQFQKGELQFSLFFDRASDTSPEFLELHYLIQSKHIPIFDSREQSLWAANKARMHREFKKAGIPVPDTVILLPFVHQEYIWLMEEEFYRLGKPFIIKPSNTTGGGIGVVKDAQTWRDVVEARQVFSSERYLLQQKIHPKEADGKRFWFRGFYTCGLVQGVWWNDISHIYEPLTAEEVEAYQLFPLFRMVERIAAICRLNFFSTEIAQDREGKFIAIDYVNEVCDMRLKSHHRDGVPDRIAERIARRIIAYILENLQKRV